MEKLPHYYFSWIVFSRNRDKCEMLPLETKKSILFNQSEDLNIPFMSQFHNSFVTNVECYLTRVYLENFVGIDSLLGLDVDRRRVCINIDVEERVCEIVGWIHFLWDRMHCWYIVNV
jgi:hypothetical protein